jgi:hypothetical protein
MIKIANKGNLFGVIESVENTQEYLEEAIKAGFLVKVDLWVINGKMCSGENYPSYKISFNDILNPSKILFQTRNSAAFSYIIENGFHGFTDGSKFSFTSKGIPISHGSSATDKTIVFFPENEPYEKIKNMDILGVCGDFVGAYV